MRIKINYLASIGLGITTTTYWKLLLFYPYGDGKLENYVHLAIFGMN